MNSGPFIRKSEPLVGDPMKTQLSTAITLPMKYHSGFTLVELMVAIAVLGILSAVALPSFSNLLKSNRMATQANSLIAGFNYARNEAVNRGVNIRVEPVVAGTDWSRGWLVRIDGNNDNDFDDAEDTVIRNYDGVESATLTSVADESIYYPAGNVDAVNTLTLRADECNGEFQRIVNVKLSGLVTLSDNKNC